MLGGVQLEHFLEVEKFLLFTVISDLKLFLIHIQKEQSVTFEGIISKLSKIHGSNIIKPTRIGNNTTQQTDISWSKRILGNEARAQMKMKIIIQDFTPNDRLHNKYFNISLFPGKPASIDCDNLKYSRNRKNCVSQFSKISDIIDPQNE